jgi:hypothetical protein
MRARACIGRWVKRRTPGLPVQRDAPVRSAKATDVMLGGVKGSEDAPKSVVDRVRESTVFGIAGPLLIAAALGLALLATNTATPDDEFLALVLYATTAGYLAGLVWDLIGAALNATARAHERSKSNYSSCLFGLAPFALIIVVLSAAVDGSGWLFDWRVTLIVLLVANLAQFLIFGLVSKRR